MKKRNTILRLGIVLGIILGFLIGYSLRDIQGFNATMPEHDSPPREKITKVCRDVWDKIQGDSRWVITQHCEDVIDRR